MREAKQSQQEEEKSLATLHLEEVERMRRRQEEEVREVEEEVEDRAEHLRKEVELLENELESMLGPLKPSPPPTGGTSATL